MARHSRRSRGTTAAGGGIGVVAVEVVAIGVVAVGVVAVGVLAAGVLAVGVVAVGMGADAVLVPADVEAAGGVVGAALALSCV